MTRLCVHHLGDEESFHILQYFFWVRDRSSYTRASVFGHGWLSGPQKDPKQSVSSTPLVSGDRPRLKLQKVPNEQQEWQWAKLITARYPRLESWISVCNEKTTCDNNTAALFIAWPPKKVTTWIKLSK